MKLPNGYWPIEKSGPLVEKTQTVRVEAQPAGTVMAVLNVTHQVVHVTTREVPSPVVVNFPASEKGNSFKFVETVEP